MDRSVDDSMVVADDSSQTAYPVQTTRREHLLKIHLQLLIDDLTGVLYEAWPHSDRDCLSVGVCDDVG